MNEHIETIIIGGGQAGLTTGYHLKRRGRPFVILDANVRLGDQWRRHYDSLRMYSFRKYSGLPGLPFPGEPYECPGRDEVAAYIESYAVHHALPVRSGTRVQSVEQVADGRFRVGLEGGDLTCDNVVVAVGKTGQPHTPEVAAELDPTITQLRSSDYRRPSQIPQGRVLVVGGAHSGADIAYELAATHPVTLCGRDPGQLPFRPEDRKARLIFPFVLFAWRHVLTRRTPVGRKMMAEVRHHGGPMIRVHRDDLAERGVERITHRVSGSKDGLPLLDDGTVVDAGAIIWATGYGHSYDWIRIPITGDDGWPVEMRGVVDQAPGLFFCGLVFQYAFGSMVFPGVGRDAEYVARRIEARAKAGAKAAPDRAHAA